MTFRHARRILPLILLLLFCCGRQLPFRWKHVNGAWTLLHEGRAVGKLAACTVPGITSKDIITRLDEKLFLITRICTNSSDGPLDSLRLCIDFIHLGPAGYCMIPAVSYNGNHWGEGNEPKGFIHDGTPWSFSSLRTAVPGATYSEGHTVSIALWGEPVQAGAPFSCSLIPAPDSTVHRLIWPEEEMPLRYSNRDQYTPGFRAPLLLAPGESVKLTAFLTADALRPNHRNIASFLNYAWRLNRRLPESCRPPQEIWDLAVRYAKNSLWAEEGVFRGFSIGLVPRTDGRWIQRPSWKYEIGWCGQNASLANSLLADYQKTGDEESRDMAILCLDTWARYAVLPNGLFRTHFDYILGIAGGQEVLDACNLGTAALNYFEAGDRAAACGISRPQYRELALAICDFMESAQDSAGRYGKGWTADGECVYRDGTIGAFLIPPMLAAHRVTGDQRYLSSAVAAFNFYYGELLANGFTSAGALDTWCIDKESSMPLLRSALMLSEITGFDRYLTAAEHISWYLSTWLWHYSAFYGPASDFQTYGYDTFGGTAVSTQHHHLDPYALFWVKDWLDLAEKTGNPQWREKALAVWQNGNQLISEGNDLIRGKVRPAGSQNEAYFQAAWSAGPGMINDWLVAWPGAFRLETLRRLDDWSQLTF
ncbi:hypothetical protein JXO52_05475 [bacterium]|nr:hypothetical protein [bacterium]